MYTPSAWEAQALHATTAPKSRSLTQGYQASEDLRQFAERTRDDYVAKIKLIESKFGDFPLAPLSDRRTRGVLMAWRAELALRSRRQADYAWAVLARVLSWAVNRGLIAANPCRKAGRFYRGSRADKIWTPDDEASFLVRRRLICICHSCSRCGPASGKATCCAFRGALTMERTATITGHRLRDVRSILDAT